jgi:hypothetical protein
MQVFDRIDPLTLENRERHLWLLALSILFLFAMGMALLMYPAAFSSPIALMVASPRETFFGFCAMVVLSVIYLVDRHFMISRLRKNHGQE